MKKNNKKPANISILVTVFCFSFIVFSAFAVDMAFVTLNRAKLQRAAETTALASVAKYKGSYLDDSRKYFNLYKTKTDTLKDAQLMNVQYKNEDNGDTKIKIEAQLVIPTYFLRFAGLKSVTIKANSYAKTYEQIQENIIFEDIVSSESLITNKSGDEIEIRNNTSTNGYFIFAGIKNDYGEYIWKDIGCKADVQTYKIPVGTNTYNLICARRARFDFSKQCTGNTDINIAKYIKIYAANPNDCLAYGTTAQEAVTYGYGLQIKILNNTKLITKDDF